jgi:hypothetical protein
LIESYSAWVIAPLSRSFFVRSAVLASLADGISLRSLGTWRFQGLREPEDLYQVEAADLLAEFPPLRSAAPV